MTIAFDDATEAQLFEYGSAVYQQGPDLQGPA
jgi:hypothetical protein